jgi:hypothetical protein
MTQRKAKRRKCDPESSVDTDALHGPLALKDSIWAQLKDVLWRFCHDPQERVKKKRCGVQKTPYFC